MNMRQGGFSRAVKVLYYFSHHERTLVREEPVLSLSKESAFPTFFAASLVVP